MRAKTLVISAISLLAAACDTEQYQPIHIAVYPSTTSCTIKEHSLQCSQLGVYLRETLKVDSTHEITVSFGGSEKVARDDKSIDRIAEVIRKAGYTNVKTVRFDM